MYPNYSLVLPLYIGLRFIAMLWDQNNNTVQISNSQSEKAHFGSFWRFHRDKLNNFDCLMAWTTGLWQIHIYLKYKFQKAILAKGRWLTEPLW